MGYFRFVANPAQPNNPPATLFFVSREGEIIGKHNLAEILTLAGKGDLLPSDHAYQSGLKDSEWVFLSHIILGFFRELPWDRFDSVLRKEKEKVDGWIKNIQQGILVENDSEKIRALNYELKKHLKLRRTLALMKREEKQVRRENEAEEREELKKIRPLIEKMADSLIERTAAAAKLKGEPLDAFEAWENDWPRDCDFPVAGSFDADYEVFKALRRLRRFPKVEALRLAKKMKLLDSESKKTESDLLAEFLIKKGVMV